MNFGGFLILTLIFSVLWLVVQRSERKRRLVTLIIMLIVAGVIWRYGIYVLARDCQGMWKILCQTFVVQRANESAAAQLVTQSVIASVVVNLLYWALLGRYNPVGSSDSIVVIGRDG